MCITAACMCCAAPLLALIPPHLRVIGALLMFGVSALLAALLMFVILALIKLKKVEEAVQALGLNVTHNATSKWVHKEEIALWIMLPTVAVLSLLTLCAAAVVYVNREKLSHALLPPPGESSTLSAAEQQQRETEKKPLLGGSKTAGEGTASGAAAATVMAKARRDAK